MRTTNYHPQCNGQVQRYNCTLVAGFRHYIDEHQQDWGVFFQPLTNAYNTQFHRKRGMIPFSLTLGCEPPGSLTITGCRGTPEEYDRMTPSEVKTKLMNRLFDFLRRAETRFSQARRTYKKNFDKTSKHLKRSKPGECFYIDKPPVLVRSRNHRCRRTTLQKS